MTDGLATTAQAQILVFDFTARGSASEELAKERALRALHPTIRCGLETFGRP